MDTNVFGASLTRRNAPLVDLYASHLVGRVIVLAAQTVAELRYGALLADWGPSRQGALERRLARARVAPVDDELAWEVARVRVACRRIGHALADDQHANDLWIAATALRYRLPLVAHDSVFRRRLGPSDRVGGPPLTGSCACVSPGTGRYAPRLPPAAQSKPLSLRLDGMQERGAALA